MTTTYNMKQTGIDTTVNKQLQIYYINYRMT